MTKITDLGELDNAIKSKNEDLNSLVWKSWNGEEVKLVDMTDAELQRCYTHANDMLYNKDRFTTGKYQVKKNIKELIAQCNAELFRRYLQYDLNIDILKTNIQVLDYIRENKKNNNLSNTDTIETLFSNVPREFSSVTIEELIDACLDRRGFNRNMLSNNFIAAQGIWLTSDEKEELTEYDENGNLRPWLDVIRERLLLPPSTPLKTKSTGLTYSEFRSIVYLESYARLSKLPSNTLRLLRDKIFVLLDVDTDYHIDKWEKIKNNIEKVAKSKGITLTQKDY